MIADRQKLLFVGGIHGIGKSTFSKSVASSLGVSCLSSGQLISQYLSAVLSSEKGVDHVSENQAFLLQALRSSSDKGPLILDGHFCLLDKADAIQAIPEIIFKEISPSAVIVLHDNVEAIRSRLLKRDNRDHTERTLREFQEAELNHAKHVCETFHFPLRLIGPEEFQVGVAFARKHLNL